MSHNRRDAYLLLGGLCLFLLVLLGFPLATNIYYSFTSVDFETIRAPVWLGIDNYLEAAVDPAFWSAMGFSLRFGVIATVAEVGLGLALAVAFEPLIRRRPWLMAILLMPMMISPALMGVMYKLMLNEFIGLIPQYLAALGFRGDLLAPDYVVGTVITIEVLQWTPFALLILLASYQSVPVELREAARIDGANAWQVFRRVVIPHMTPAIAITVFIRFIDSFRVFDHIFVLTGGGPGAKTTSASIYLYKAFFTGGNLAEAIAASLILLLMTLALLFAALQFVLRRQTR